MLTQSYIDSKYTDWQSRLSLEMANLLRDQLQVRYEMECVEAELADQCHGAPMVNADTMAIMAKAAIK